MHSFPFMVAFALGSIVVKARFLVTDVSFALFDTLSMTTAHSSLVHYVDMI